MCVFFSLCAICVRCTTLRQKPKFPLHSLSHPSRSSPPRSDTASQHACTDIVTKVVLRNSRLVWRASDSVCLTSPKWQRLWYICEHKNMIAIERTDDYKTISLFGMLYLWTEIAGESAKVYLKTDVTSRTPQRRMSLKRRAALSRAERAEIYV